MNRDHLPAGGIPFLVLTSIGGGPPECSGGGAGGGMGHRTG